MTPLPDNRASTGAASPAGRGASAAPPARPGAVPAPTATRAAALRHPRRARPERAQRHRPGRGQQQRQAIGQARQVRQRGGPAFEVAGARLVAPFLGPPARGGDPLRQIAVAAPRGGQHHQPHRHAAHAGLQPHLGADDQVQAAFAGLLVGVHHARQRALVGDGQRGVAQQGRAIDQFLGRRGAREKAEVAATVQFGVGGERGHGDGDGDGPAGKTACHRILCITTV